jgi:serine/threonine protein phosphatase PrpC
MQSWGLTDPGCVRTQNQDSYQIEQLDRNSLLCVVCDGMGGAKSGNVASSLATDVFVQEIKQTWTSGMDQKGIEKMLRAAVKLANFTVFDQAAQFEDFSGMGTTLVAALVKGNEVTFGATIDGGCGHTPYFAEFGSDKASEEFISPDNPLNQLVIEIMRGMIR